ATFLERINDVYDFGVYAIQAHRKAKNKNTDIAVLDAVSEEINNSIFRKGHINAGLSSALIGSGMAIDYPWFVQNIKKVSSAGEDKELELLLLSQGVYIEYLDSVIVYDEKTPGSSSFYQQRRRWLGAQFFLLKKDLSSFPQALFSGNINYVDKLFQWLLFPRILLLGISFGLACITLIVDYTLSFKWWGILVLLFITLSIAMPDELYDESFKRALKRVPILFILMLLNLFRTKGAGRNFIHTKHGGENV
ncbi:MAG: glycosyltransferase family 2 protein, partial [Massilibacteroides sp.]|nr:glycosyltransferase family 2 protein [Massilibacteroides sp.]